MGQKGHDRLYIIIFYNYLISQSRLGLRNALKETQFGSNLYFLLLGLTIISNIQLIKITGARDNIQFCTIRVNKNQLNLPLSKGQCFPTSYPGKLEDCLVPTLHAIASICKVQTNTSMAFHAVACMAYLIALTARQR